MGYNIYIGNAQLESSWPKNEDDDKPRAEWEVAPITMSEAPYFSDSGRGNGRDPSYTAWADFCRDVGLTKWMLDRHEGKMGQHPGYAPLFPSDAEMLTEKLEEYRQQHPNEEAKFCECSACDPFGHTRLVENTNPHNPNASGTLVRLTWLTWWVNWAVKYCERPAIHNT